MRDGRLGQVKAQAQRQRLQRGHPLAWACACDGRLGEVEGPGDVRPASTAWAAATGNTVIAVRSRQAARQIPKQRPLGVGPVRIYLEQLIASRCRLSAACRPTPSSTSGDVKPLGKSRSRVPSVSAPSGSISHSSSPPSSAISSLPANTAIPYGLYQAG